MSPDVVIPPRLILLSNPIVTVLSDMPVVIFELPTKLKVSDSKETVSVPVSPEILRFVATEIDPAESILP
jgi:hypothetical protein